MNIKRMIWIILLVSSIYYIQSPNTIVSIISIIGLVSWAYWTWKLIRS